MGSGGKNVTELFDLLESNKLRAVEETKKVFHDHFLATKDNWLVNGLFDYYLSTNSLRAVEVLVGVKEPHDKHLLDRLAEALIKHSGNGQGQRVQALTLLGHVVRRHPTWIYKLPNHCLFERLLKLLKVDGEILALMSALLLLVTLLPMLPVYLNPFLNDIFEVFPRLAAYHHQQSSSLASLANSASSSADMERDRLYLLHLQVGLDSLFHRLYAMYPCNFISFLKQHYRQRDLSAFAHTVRPMLDSVPMHPSLVIATEEKETSASRWKKMEHHDVVAECDRFSLNRTRDDVPIHTGHHPHFMHTLLESSRSHGLIDGGVKSVIKSTDEEGFWSPSMTMPPNSPPPHETRSTPSTPNNIRIGASPPEAAVEATPETTPVKDLRQLPARLAPASSAAVRAFTFGNGLSSDSRPSTPTAMNPSSTAVVSSASGTVDNNSNSTNSHAILSQKITKLFAERQSSQLGHSHASTPSEFEPNNDSLRSLQDLDPYVPMSANGGNDYWQEDHEVLEIVRDSQKNTIGAPESNTGYMSEEKYVDSTSAKNALADLSRTVHRLRFYSQCQAPMSQQIFHNPNKVRRTNSCPEMQVKDCDSLDSAKTACGEIKNVERSTEEASTQTQDLVPYEHLLFGIVSSGPPHRDQSSKSSLDSCLLPNYMVDRYIQACARINHYGEYSKPTKGNGKHKQLRPKKKGTEDDASSELAEDDGVDHIVHMDLDSGNQLLQLTQMQLQFERQRREVHAERNRRLQGKLRDSQALEEDNSALRDRLRILEAEGEDLKAELERTKKEARQAEKRHLETHSYLQMQCAEEQQRSRDLDRLAEVLKLELEEERAKVAQGLRDIRAAEAALFDAAHHLKGALKAANQGKLLKCALDALQKRFLLLGEVQLKLQERTVGPTTMARQEAAQIQRAYAEEISSLRRQVESRTSLVEALKARLVELEGGEAQREALLNEQHQLLQEVKERHEAELEALESKYKAQRAINLHLEERVLELLGSLEDKSSTVNAYATNTVSSASPKERSPPLSVSLASSSEGSLAFMHSGGGTGIVMSDCCDPAGEITNLQAIVDPGPSPSHTGQTQQRQPSA
ncbi:hamartin [Athalia rosae]|uniref:hamartin n=1 Tax=Athalia rosae TaxID=37344 RepID=UPI002034562A|nr:hamartin [Athalia rosae]